MIKFLSNLEAKKRLQNSVPIIALLGALLLTSPNASAKTELQDISSFWISALASFCLAQLWASDFLKNVLLRFGKPDLRT